MPVKWREKVLWGDLRVTELRLFIPWWPMGVFALLFKVAVRKKKKNVAVRA